MDFCCLKLNHFFLQSKPFPKNVQIIVIEFMLFSILNPQAALDKVNRTGNQDIVEGLFDGLMQVMVCGVSINVLYILIVQL